MTKLILLDETELSGTVEDVIISMEHAINQLKKYNMCQIDIGMHSITINLISKEVGVLYETKVVADPDE